MGYKPKSDSYLMSMTKAQIIEELRVAEHNFFATEETLNNSAKAGMEIAEKYDRAKELLKEAKRLLKMAVEDISKMPCNNDTHSPDSCYICVKHGNCSYADSFKWCKADIALKLLNDEK